VIVGTAFVRRLLDAADAADAVGTTGTADPAAGTRAIADLAAELSAAVRRPPRP
jgi:hypothetical protein